MLEQGDPCRALVLRQGGDIGVELVRPCFARNEIKHGAVPNEHCEMRNILLDTSRRSGGQSIPEARSMCRTNRSPSLNGVCFDGCLDLAEQTTDDSGVS